VDLAYAPPPPAVVLILVLPPAPIASTDTKEAKSAGTVNVVPEVMNTVLTAIGYWLRVGYYFVSYYRYKLCTVPCAAELSKVTGLVRCGD
jgi:hypothetical protein